VTEEKSKAVALRDRAKISLATAVTVLTAVLLLAAPSVGATQTESAKAGQPTSEPSQPLAEQIGKRVNELEDQVDGVSSDSHETRTIEVVVLAPLAVLVAILAAGGVLGVVYSVREQQRTGQLHELTVGGEIASQRRSEQSYGSFLEQSQTTLSLVNDTLGLAKEATDRAAHSMDLKAKSRVGAIEERAQKLMLDVFGEREFELIINDAARRNELHSIAAELRSLEGYLSLQDIKLPQYTKFVKAIDQFLLDDTEASLQALRLASQDRVVGDLQKYIEYWLGYMLTTVGEYDEAVSRFRHDEIDLKKDDAEYFQLERIIAETEFFQIAKTNAQREIPKKGKKKKTTSPQKRFELVAKLLDDLTRLAKKLEKSDRQETKQHTKMEIARTRADIYEWIAYDPRHLDEQLDETAINDAREILRRHPRAQKIGDRAAKFVSSSAWKALRDPDHFRVWALQQALDICEEQKKGNLDVDFARAECRFKLRHKKAESAFERAEHSLHHEFGELHEKRRSASIQQSVLICHARLLMLRSGKKQRRAEKRQINQASRDTRDVLREMRQSRVTVFSQIQRRNITQGEFKDEVAEIVKQSRGGKDKDR
jgi:tetratricopeptide (TPR) repeat protein